MGPDVAEHCLLDHKGSGSSQWVNLARPRIGVGNSGSSSVGLSYVGRMTCSDWRMGSAKGSSVRSRSAREDAVVEFDAGCARCTGMTSKIREAQGEPALIAHGTPSVRRGAYGGT
jgi:hypothetical protein